MSIIVHIIHSAPSMNTHSQKKNTLSAAGPQFGHGDIDLQKYFFALPNTLDDNSYVHLVQQETSLFDLQDLDHQDILIHKEAKTRLVEQRAIKRREKDLERVVRLKRELLRKALLGKLGLVWRNQEQRPKGIRRVKRRNHHLQ